MGFVLSIYFKDGAYWADLPGQVIEVPVCYYTTSKELNQCISYERRLENGHDYQIINNKIKTYRSDLKGLTIFIPSEKIVDTICDYCLQENICPSNFCSFCGAKLI